MYLIKKILNLTRSERVNMIYNIFQTNIISLILEWLELNLLPIIVSAITIIIGIIIFRVIKYQFNRLVEKENLAKATAKNIVKLIKYFIVLIVMSAIIMQFAQTIGLITAMLTLAGGTIIGFATINTLGNAVAGIIIMISKPFIVGDRIMFNGKMADIIDIRLVYTVLRDLDNVKISIPNQKLLTEEIENYGKENEIRISVKVTPGFDENRKKVEEVLLRAAKKLPEAMEEPEPHVWINQFQNYAVEYIIFVYITDIKNLPAIQSDLHKIVFDECKANEIDISTPLLLRQLGD